MVFGEINEGKCINSGFLGYSESSKRLPHVGNRLEV